MEDSMILACLGRFCSCAAIDLVTPDSSNALPGEKLPWLVSNCVALAMCCQMSLEDAVEQHNGAGHEQVPTCSLKIVPLTRIFK